MKKYKKLFTIAVLVGATTVLSACNMQKLQALEDGLRGVQSNYNMMEYGNPNGYQQPQYQPRRQMTCTSRRTFPGSDTFTGYTTNCY